MAAISSRSAAAAADFPITRKYDTGPYAKWVAAYAGPEFAAEADRVEAVMERLARECPELQPEMDKAVAAGTRQELEYWKI